MGERVTGVPHIDNEATDINNNTNVNKTWSRHNRGKKPARKSNFSQAEIIAMLEEIQGSKEVITSRLQNNLTHRMKAEAW